MRGDGFRGFDAEAIWRAVRKMRQADQTRLSVLLMILRCFGGKRGRENKRGELTVPRSICCSRLHRCFPGDGVSLSWLPGFLRSQSSQIVLILRRPMLSYRLALIFDIIQYHEASANPGVLSYLRHVFILRPPMFDSIRTYFILYSTSLSSRAAHPVGARRFRRGIL